MNTQRPYKINEIDFSNIVYPKMKGDKNKKIVMIKYNEDNKLRNFVFQTPTLINLYEPHECNGYKEIEVALESKDKLKMINFIDFLNNLERKIKQDAQENAGLWFDLDNSTINLQKIIRESDDFDNGTLKLKLISNKDFETDIQFNGLKSITPKCVCKMILECYAIWINKNNDFGIFFRPILISFSPNKDRYNYKFLEDSDSENENEMDIPDTEVNTNSLFLKVGKTINNDNDETSSLLEINKKYNNSEFNMSEIYNNSLDKISLSNDSSDNILREGLKETTSDTN